MKNIEKYDYYSVIKRPWVTEKTELNAYNNSSDNANSAPSDSVEKLDIIRRRKIAREQRKLARRKKILINKSKRFAKSLKEEKKPSSVVNKISSSEKTRWLSKHSFLVASSASKPLIKAAIEKIFPKAKVLAVNVINLKGTTRRFKGRIGHTSDRKKAIVTLSEGSIDLGGGIIE